MLYKYINNINPLKEDFKIPLEYRHARLYEPESILKTEVISKLNELGFLLREVQLFTSQPYEFTKIHIDGYSLESRSSLNYIIGDGEMIWYDIKEGVDLQKYVNVHAYPDVKTPGYFPIDLDDVEFKDKHKLGSGLTLIETSVAHNIDNRSSFKSRYCFSIRFANGLTFKDAESMLANWK